MKQINNIYLEKVFYVRIYQYLEKCTGSFQENGKRPTPNTKCVGPCIQEAGRWGNSYCYTDKEKSQWGAECINCQGI